MKQQLTIGREESCDIIISDNSDVISRRHAILNIDSYGRMTITDLSTNGTYVNGIRIASNVPVPVTKKDTVSLAHVSQLDWSRVSAPNLILKRALFGLLLAVIFVCAVFGISQFMGGGKGTDIPVVKDSIQVNKEVVKQPETPAEKKDTANAKSDAKDSTATKKDSVQTKPKVVSPKKKEPKAKKDSVAKTVRPIL